MNVHFSHIYREGYCVADKIANHVVRISENAWWYSTPSFISTELARDMSGLPNYRFVS